MQEYYYPYSDYLRRKYGKKAYKLPVQMELGCPNRDGATGIGGCTFCSEKGTAFENRSKPESISGQLESMRLKIARRYGANRFIAYFQNYTNTYQPLDSFKAMLEAARADDVVEICIATRPDCIDGAYMAAMAAFRERTGIETSLEFGLQTTNEETLAKINRGHGVEAYNQAMALACAFKLPVTTHLILNLPWDGIDDVKEMARLMNVSGTEVVKLHSLYLAKGTRMASQYLAGEFSLETMEAYVERAAMFLGMLDEQIAVARLVSRVPEEEAVFCNWGRSWWVVRDAIVNYMAERGWTQGCLKNGGI